MTKITNLVFDGGGVKSIAYAGALEELVATNTIKEDEIERIAGTSAGSIVAMLMAVGYTVKDIETIMSEIDFSKFIETNRYTATYAARVYNYYGLYKGAYPLESFEKFIQRKTGCRDLTFSQLHALREEELAEFGSSQYKDLYTTGFCLEDQKCVTFSYEHNFADLPISKAVIISMSIPFVYEPTLLDGKNYVDGGVNLHHGYKINIFDKLKYIVPSPNGSELGEQQRINPNTLGIRMHYVAERAPVIKDMSSYFSSVILAITDNAFSYRLSTEDAARTIYCDPLDVHTTDFNLTTEQKHALIRSGHTGVQEFLVKHLAALVAKESQPLKNVEGSIRRIQSAPCLAFTPAFDNYSDNVGFKPSVVNAQYANTTNTRSNEVTLGVFPSMAVARDVTREALTKEVVVRDEAPQKKSLFSYYLKQW